MLQTIRGLNVSHAFAAQCLKNQNVMLVGVINRLWKMNF